MNLRALIKEKLLENIENDDCPKLTKQQNIDKVLDTIMESILIQKTECIKSKPLDIDVLKELGFELQGAICEEHFCIEEWSCPLIVYSITIYFYFYKNGKTSYRVELYGGYEIQNIGQDGLVMLMNILPRSS
ncbi:hypothetical protein [Mesonia hippocampi]|uniref:hypothetical protein n=1 Tax=Mesonia hippocampi TaxID=1628250 RepID=UPI003F999B6B